jgi:hypothetical protein
MQACRHAQTQTHTHKHQDVLAHIVFFVRPLKKKIYPIATGKQFKSSFYFPVAIEESHNTNKKTTINGYTV